MMTAGNKSGQAVQGRGSASVVNGNTTVEVAVRMSSIVAVIVSIIVLLAGSG